MLTEFGSGIAYHRSCGFVNLNDFSGRFCFFDLPQNRKNNVCKVISLLGSSLNLPDDESREKAADNASSNADNGVGDAGKYRLIHKIAHSFLIGLIGGVIGGLIGCLIAARRK
jgi:hypothetical protein